MKTNNALSSLESILKSKLVKQYRQHPKRDKKFGVVYTRVSSQEQAENNSSLEVQLKLCKDYAQREGITVKEYFGGSYESAKSDSRKAFQKMLTYVRKDRDVAFIIVYNYDRFSRTGPEAAQLSIELAKKGILVKSVTQDIDSSTPTGKFQENLFHLFNNYDNQQRASRTSTNTRELMLKGYWPYMTPLGYQNLKPKHRACDHKYIITEQGKWLKKAFQLKAEGILSNKEIIDKLKESSVGLKDKNFRWLISNPFYAGYVTGKLVDGELIKGHHPPLIDLATFLKANDMLKAEPTAGIAKTHRVDELPLKIFAKADGSGCPLTGYIKKGHWYYKTRSTGGKVNVSAKKLNSSFVELLQQFEYSKQFKNALKTAITSKLKSRLKEEIQDSIQLKKRQTELESQLERMEERYVLGDLKKDLFEKYAEKFQVEIGEISTKIDSGGFDSSNLNFIVEKGIKIAEKLSQLWVSSDFSSKQKIQYLVFPEGILYDKETNTVRTSKINALFAEIPCQKRILEENEKGNPLKDCLKSHPVP